MMMMMMMMLLMLMLLAVLCVDLITRLLFIIKVLVYVLMSIYKLDPSCLIMW